MSNPPDPIDRALSAEMRRSLLLCWATSNPEALAEIDSIMADEGFSPDEIEASKAAFGAATPSKPATIAEIPNYYGKPDDKIAALLDQVRLLNEQGKIDSIAIVTTDYGGAPQIRRRTGRTRTTLIGALTVLVHQFCDDTRDYISPIDVS